MSSLLVYIENRALGGGTKYLQSLTTALSGAFSEITVISNHGGFRERELNGRGVEKYCEVFFFSLHKLHKRISKTPESMILMRKAASLISKLVELPLQILNLLLFSIKLLIIRPTSVLVANGGFPASHSSQAMVLAARIQGIPVVLSVVSMPTKRDKRFFALELIYDLLVWKSCNSVIANSEAIIEALRQERGLNDTKTLVVYNGIPDLINQELVHVFNPTSDKIKIAAIGRIETSKGVDLLFDTFVRISKEFPNCELHFVGSGERLKHLISATNKLGLQNQVTFNGRYEEDIAGFLKDIDIVVIPSFWEGLPYVLFEGMRSGNAILASSVGGIPHVISDGMDGLLFDIGSSQQLEIKLRELLRDGNLRAKIGKSGRNKFLMKYTSEKTYKSVINAFEISNN